MKKLELTEERAVYEYYPNGNTAHPGIVALDLKTGERLILQESTEDFGKRYAFHALRRIEEYAEQGEFREEGLVGWG